MNRIVFFLVMTALTTSAHARDTDGFGFLQCGLKLGGQYPTYTADPKTTSHKNTWTSKQPGSVAGTESVVFNQSATEHSSVSTHLPDPSNSFEFRLPPKVTVAGIGCSWL